MVRNGDVASTELPVNPLYNASNVLPHRQQKDSDEQFHDACRTLDFSSSSSTAASSMPQRSPVQTHKRVHSDPSVPRSPELKRTSTFPKMENEPSVEDIEREVKDLPKARLLPDHQRQQNSEQRSHSITETGSAGAGGDADLFSIRFNPRSDAISFEVKVESEEDDLNVSGVTR